MWGKPDAFLPGRVLRSGCAAASQACERWGYALSPETLCTARQVRSLPLFRRCRNRLRETERQSQGLFFTLFLEM